jgi:hypothetical protein
MHIATHVPVHSQRRRLILGCVNSKAYPANTCIVEREHHLRAGTKLVADAADFGRLMANPEVIQPSPACSLTTLRGSLSSGGWDGWPRRQLLETGETGDNGTFPDI